MLLPHSLQASAIFLSFSSFTEAWVVLRKSAVLHGEQKREGSAGLSRRMLEGDFAKRQGDITELNCPNDRWEQMLDNNPEEIVQTFCNIWLGIAPATTTIEVTPTSSSTITTAASTTTAFTSTQRIIVTKTVNETVFTTVPALKRRAANLAEAEGEKLIESVVASGTAAAAEPATSDSPQRLQAETGLANACSCKMVDPTEVVSELFTLPAVTETVGVRRVVVERVTATRSFTTTTTLTVASQDLPSATALTINSTTPVPNTTLPESSLSSQTSQTLQVSTAGDSTVLPLTTSAPLAVGNSTNSSSSVVTALPFNCPEQAGEQIQQVVDGVRLDYLVLCNTELITADRRRPPTVAVNSETECAARCSILNAEGSDTCKGTTFELNDSGSGGVCSIHTDDPEYANKDGAIAIVHTGTLANGNECANIESGEEAQGVDTSAAVAAVTGAPIALSTPGLVTQSADGGVFQTYVSANSTDASGYVHWSWYAVSASSSFWWAVYSTSWECTATLTRTIVTQQTQPVTVYSVVVTTIIAGGTTSIISGTSTRVITGGNGLIGPPTFVPASTTDDNDQIITFFTAASQTASETGIASASSNGGAGNATVSFATSTFFSTGSAGVIAPSSISPSVIVEMSVATGNGQFSSAGSTFTNASIGTGGVIPPPISTGGSAVSSTSGGTLVINSTGTGSILTPIIPTETSSVSPLSAQEVVNSTLVSGGTAVWLVSGSTGAAFSTGGFGVILPAQAGNATTGALVTVTSGVVIVSSGEAILTTSNGTSTAFSTGAFGVIPPAITSSAGASNVTILEISSTGGNGDFTVASSVATSFQTGASGVIPPPSTNITSLFATTATPIVEFNISSLVGTGQFSTSGATTIVLSTGGSGVISPSTSNVTDSITTAVFPSSIPLPQVNVSSTGGSGVFSVQGSTGVIFSTGSNGIIPPASITPSPSFNGTSTLSSSTGTPFSNSGDNRSGSYSRSRSSSRVSLGSTGVIVPSSNASVTIPATSFQPSITPSVSLNASTSIATPFTNTPDNRSGDYSRSRSTSAPSGSLPAPSTNITTSAIPAISTLVPPPFQINTTAPPGTGFTVQSVSISTPSVNSTATIPATTGNTTVSVPSITPSASLNVSTSILPTGNFSIPSATLSISLNSTTTPDLCPTAPVFVTFTEIATSVQVLTTTVVHTVTVGGEASMNFESSTSIQASTTISDVLSASSAVLPTDAIPLFRVRGTPATQEQIDAACADTSSIVQNPDFAVADGAVPGWEVDNTDPAITIGTEQSPNGNGTIAQFKSAVVGRTLAILQPLTLCPGQQYNISGKHRQENPYANCSVLYTIGDREVLSVEPQADWISSSALFTAGQGVEGASVDLTVTASCSGFAGLTVGDPDGLMRVEVSSVNVVQQRATSKRYVSNVLSKKWQKRTTTVQVLKPVEKFMVFTWSEDGVGADVSR